MQRRVALHRALTSHLTRSADSVRVCGARRACTPTSGAAADAWLSAALGRPCRLVRCAEAATASGAFVNEGQLLLVNAASVRALRDAVRARSGEDAACRVSESLFRANVVVDSTLPYEEDSWRLLRTSGDTDATTAVRLRVSGACGRCAQVCALDGHSGQRAGPEPLLTLSAQRMRAGRPRFGVLLTCDGGIGKGEKDAGGERCGVGGGPVTDTSEEAWMRRRWRHLLRVGQALTPERTEQPTT